ncbi:MAG: hypothetical protein ABI841_05455 [Chloroflexota bacterium]
MTAHSRPASLGRPAAVALAVVLCAGATLPAGTSRAAEPNEAAGARHLADTLGGAPNDYTLLHERTLVPDHGGAPMWSAKYLDRRTGEIHAVYRDPTDGALAGRSGNEEGPCELELALDVASGEVQTLSADGC